MFGIILDIYLLSKFNLIKDFELVMGIVLFWIKEFNLKVIKYYLKSVIICMIMLKVKLKVFFYYDVIGGEKNLIEIVVLEMIEIGLEEVYVNFLIYYIKFEYNVKSNLVDCKLIYGFV